MLRKIKLYGSLAKFVGKRVLYAEVDSAAEAVRYLIANWPQARAHMANRHYRVKVGDQYIKPQTHELHVLAGSETISFIPVVVGAGQKAIAVATIVIGVILIVASAGIAGGAIIPLTSIAFGEISLAVGIIGAGLILSGTASLLTSTPQVPGSASSLGGGGGGGDGFSGGSGTNTNKDARKSYSFSNIQNVSRQGLAIPVVYGETVVGSIVASAGISAVRKKK